MIKKVITNNYIYKNNKPEFVNDTYERYYEIKIYFLWILIYKRELFEIIDREDEKGTNIGFKN
jgi:hypothetical protein